MELPEIVYGTDNKEINYRIGRLVKEGRLGNYPDLKAQLEGSNAFEEEGKVLVF